MDFAVDSKELFMAAQLILFGVTLLLAEICLKCFKKIYVKSVAIEDKCEYWDRFLLIVASVGIFGIFMIAMSLKLSLIEVLILIVMEYLLFATIMRVNNRREQRLKIKYSQKRRAKKL
ncbi:MAG: hypothetical protein JW682_00535 [Campylobacterales bacterium]|nr:hypothetical protein [Campylobacterales bacterium]HEO98480.1 hypothetical protein [Campylobacterota bacterium]